MVKPLGRVPDWPSGFVTVTFHDPGSAFVMFKVQLIHEEPMTEIFVALIPG